MADVRQAARAVLADDGSAGLTMRSVATRLGVRPNTLYSHVAGKDGLVDELLDDTLVDVTRPRPDAADPKAAIREVFASTYRVLTEQPDLVPFYLRRQGVNGPHAQRLGELVIGLLARAGVDDDNEARQALRVLIVHTIGSAAFDQPDPGDVATASFDRSLDWLINGIIGAPD